LKTLSYMLNQMSIGTLYHTFLVLHANCSSEYINYKYINYRNWLQVTINRSMVLEIHFIVFLDFVEALGISPMMKLKPWSCWPPVGSTRSADFWTMPPDHLMRCPNQYMCSTEYRWLSMCSSEYWWLSLSVIFSNHW
jgi:hypothetical protein